MVKRKKWIKHLAFKKSGKRGKNRKRDWEEERGTKLKTIKGQGPCAYLQNTTLGRGDRNGLKGPRKFKKKGKS